MTKKDARAKLTQLLKRIYADTPVILSQIKEAEKGNDNSVFLPLIEGVRSSLTFLQKELKIPTAQQIRYLKDEEYRNECKRRSRERYWKKKNEETELADMRLKAMEKK